MDPILRTATLPTGVTLQYAEQGDPTGLPVLLLHGYSDSWFSYASVLPYLPNSWRVIVPSQRGHGDSDKPETGYRMADFAADAAALLDQLDVPRAAICGHSMGSHISQRFAVDYPDRVMALILLGPIPQLHGNADMEAFCEPILQFTDPVDPAFVTEFQESTLARPVLGDFLAKIVKESLKLPAHVWRGACAGMMQAENVSEYGMIKAPTLILSGGDDGFISPQDRSALASGISGAELVVYDAVGHALHWEQPQHVAQDIQRFIALSLPAAAAE